MKIQIGERITIAGISDSTEGPGEVVNPAKKGNPWVNFAPVRTSVSSPKRLRVTTWCLLRSIVIAPLFRFYVASLLSHLSTGPAYQRRPRGVLQGRAPHHLRGAMRGS